MTYRVRFESNAFQADSAVQRLLNIATGLGNRLQQFAGIRVERRDINSLQRLYGINARVFEQLMDWVDQDFDQQIVESQWAWREGVTTRRKNGEQVTQPRDIVDAGSLLQSKTRMVTGRSSQEFLWSAEHAQGVHDGYTSRSGIRLPARPWTEETIEELDIVIEAIGNNEVR
jgi:hypothetical protein